MPFRLTSSSLDREGTTNDDEIKNHFLEDFRQIISSQEDLRWVALEETAFSQVNRVLWLKFADLSFPLSSAHGNACEEGRPIDY